MPAKFTGLQNQRLFVFSCNISEFPKQDLLNTLYLALKMLLIGSKINICGVVNEIRYLLLKTCSTSAGLALAVEKSAFRV